MKIILSIRTTGDHCDVIHSAINVLALNNIKKENYDVRC